MKQKGINITILRIGLYHWVVPMYGNKHYCPYGTLGIEYKDNDTNTTERVYAKTKGDTYTKDFNDCPYQYITIKGWRYKVINKGSMYNPIIELKKLRKEIINRKTYWHDD